MMNEATVFTPPHPLRTAVLFLVFNRLDTTKQVFEAIRQAKPPQLYVAADGPRADRSGEDKKVRDVRDYVLGSIDWDCEVKTLFRHKNLGCKIAISSAIDWFFENEKEGIILEDDCLPHPSFFRFCEELLDKYREDERISMISGNNFQFGKKRTEYSYYFSRYPHIWGWASWRRAWKNYDVKMEKWPEIRKGNWLLDYLGNQRHFIYWTEIFDTVFSEQIDTWDYQWTFTCWTQNALNIIPNVNLVSNIGFGVDSTHTKEKNIFSEMDTEPISYPLSHFPFIIRDYIADDFTEKNNFSGAPLSTRLNKKLKSVMEKVLP